MKTVLLVASLGLVGLGSGAPDPDGSIAIRYGAKPATISIDPDGKIEIQNPTMTVEGADERVTYSAPASEYRRVRALLKPLRAYAGRSLPCDVVSPSTIIPGGWTTVNASVRWEGDGAAGSVPLGCPRGPAQDEIELVRAAIDALRKAAADWAELPVDGAANAVSVDLRANAD